MRIVSGFGLIPNRKSDILKNIYYDKVEEWEDEKN